MGQHELCLKVRLVVPLGVLTWCCNLQCAQAYPPQKHVHHILFAIV